MHCQVPDNYRKADIVRFAAKHTEGSVVYLGFALPGRDSPAWVVVKHGAEEIKYGANYDEYILYSPGQPLDNDWCKESWEVRKVFEKTWAQKGHSLAPLVYIRFRNDISISPISFCVYSDGARPYR